MKKERVVNKIHINRFAFISGLLLFLVIIIRLIYLNLATEIDNINLQDFAKKRNTTKETLYATRGNIYDSKGETLTIAAGTYTTTCAVTVTGINYAVNAGFEDGRRDSHLYLSNPPRNDEWEITCGSNVKRDPISGSLHMKETGVSDKI